MKLLNAFFCTLALTSTNPSLAKKYKDRAISYRGPVQKVLAMLNPHFGGWDDEDEVVVGPAPVVAVVAPLVPDVPNEEAMSDSDLDEDSDDDEFDDLPYQPLVPLPGVIAVALGTR